MWDFFGEIWVINLESRKDRKKNVDIIGRVLDIPLKYYHPQKNVDGKRGCYESHQHIMRTSTAEHVLIFEDDIDVRDFDFRKLRECTRFLSSHPYDVFFLGCFPDVWTHPQWNVYGNIYNVHATQAHAYVIHRSYADRLKDRPYDGVPFDNIFKTNNRAYALLPSVFVQGTSETDVSSVKFISKMRGKNVLVSAAEQYAMHVGVPMYLLFVCVAAILLHPN